MKRLNSLVYAAVLGAIPKRFYSHSIGGLEVNLRPAILFYSHSIVAGGLDVMS